jgi:predicted phage tail protein
LRGAVLSGQIADIDGLTALKDAVDQLGTHLGLTITLRQGHVAERVNEGVMEMKEKVEEALRTGAVDKRMMAAYQPVVSMWEKEVERAQQRQHDTANATAKIEGEAAAWKAQAEAYKKQLDDVTLRLQQMEARQGGPLAPVQVNPDAPTPPGKDARKDRR